MSYLNASWAEKRSREENLDPAGHGIPPTDLGVEESF